jgi:hypothetical protein
MSGEFKVKRTVGRPHSLRKAQAIRNVGKMIQKRIFGTEETREINTVVIPKSVNDSS